MGYTPLSEARANLGLKDTNTSSSGYVPLDQARAKLLTKPTSTVKPSSPKPTFQSTVKPTAKPQSNPFNDFVTKISSEPIIGKALKTVKDAVGQDIQAGKSLIKSATPKKIVEIGTKMAKQTAADLFNATKETGLDWARVPQQTIDYIHGKKITPNPELSESAKSGIDIVFSGTKAGGFIPETGAVKGNVGFILRQGKNKTVDKIISVIPKGKTKPTEIIGAVIKSGAENTPEGKAIVKASLEIEKQGKTVSIEAPQIKKATVSKPKEVQSKVPEETFYRGEGGEHKFKGVAGFAAGRNFATDKNIAKEFGKVTEYNLKPNAKVLKINAVGKSLEELAKELNVTYSETISATRLREALRKKGYDAIQVTERRAIDGKITEKSPTVTNLMELTDNALVPKPLIKQQPKVEVKPQEVKLFDKKGNEITGKKLKLYSSKEAQAVQDVVSSQIARSGATADSQETLIKSVTKVVDNAIEKAKGERYALSGIRTSLNKELFNAAGVSQTSNYKANYAELQTIMRESPEIGDYLKLIESKKNDVENLLISGEEKVATAQKTSISTEISREKPTTPPIEGTGKTKVRGLAEGVNEKAVKQKLTRGFKDLPEYQSVNLDQQSKKAVDLLKNEPERAKRIAMGQEIPPNDTIPEAVFVAVENEAIIKGDVETLRQLATSSSLTTEATTMGQRIRTLGERDPDSPVSSMRSVSEARKAAVEKRTGKAVKDAINSEAAKIKSKVKAVDKYDWNNFIQSLPDC